MFWLGRPEAGLPRRRREIDVDLGGRHGVGLAKLWAALVDGWERLLALVHGHAGLLRVLIVHVGAKTKGVGLELRKGLLLGQQARRDVRAVAGADVRLVVVEVELAKLHDLLEQRRVLLGIEQGRGVLVVEAVVVAHVRRGMGGRHIAVRVRRRAVVPSVGGHVAPLVPLAVCRAGVERSVSRVRGRREGALAHVGRGMGARAALAHRGQQVRRGGRVGLRRRHLVHEVRGVDGGVLRLGVQQLGIEGGGGEERRVNGLARRRVALGEQTEVEVRALGYVEVVVALRPKVRARGGLVGGRAGRVQVGRVLQRGLRGGEEVRIEGLSRGGDLDEAGGAGSSRGRGG